MTHRWVSRGRQQQNLQFAVSGEAKRQSGILPTSLTARLRRQPRLSHGSFHLSWVARQTPTPTQAGRPLFHFPAYQLIDPLRVDGPAGEPGREVDPIRWTGNGVS